MNKNILFATIAGLLLIGGIYYTTTTRDNNMNPEIDTGMRLTENRQPTPIKEDQETIVEIALSNENFSTLVAALTAANLVDVLSGDGPFTVFAPTDAAFDKLPAGTVDNLLNNPSELAKILTYHVVSGNVQSAEVVALTSATTLQGQEVQIKVEDGQVFINDAIVTQADIQASNGVIHVIDTVLLPE